tara:strand:- start:185 stop:466 length:282 start_codon:yes stop_codon:yes gene_type:complete
MLKSDLILNINKKFSALSPKDIETIVDIFFNKIVDSLKNGKNIEIRGFGTFSKKINKAKYVRNPKSNAKIYKEESFKIHFKIGKILHQRINSI